MEEKKLRELTRAEEEIMQVLWKIEKGFVRNILEELKEPRPAYNTVSTIVRILEKKGFVGFEAHGKSHEYYPLVAKDEYRRFTLKNLISGYFGGSFQNLVRFFAHDNDLSLEEIEAILKEKNSQSDNPKS